MTIAPALKHGVGFYLTPDQSQLVVGTRFRRIPFPADWDGLNPARMLELMDGKRTLSEICQISNIAPEQIKKLLTELQRHDLVDLFRTPISYVERYNPEVGEIEPMIDTENFQSQFLNEDYAIRNFLSRMELECNAATFSAGDVDAGRTAVINRRRFAILIFGKGKIVNNLLGILSASGFSQIRVINRLRVRNPYLKITEQDLSGGFVNRNHIGQSRRQVLDQLKTISSLYPGQSDSGKSPDLVISVGQPTPDSLQRWSSENTRYLLVDIASSGEVRVGPLVIPGKTPCFRCTQLSSNLNEDRTAENRDLEVGVTMSYAIAATIAADVSQIAAHKKSVFLATSITYSMRNFHKPEVHHWMQHPGCGCSWS
ncbi:MAG: hypothetical protein FGM47_02365 [Candidatus Nanopelagicaceae bacterium]|nr:hypothetical protein [Candidatus Nanopelagicaceae bacterium]